MSHTCQLREEPHHHIVAMRARSSLGTLPQTLEGIFSAVAGYLAELGVEPAGPPFTAYYNSDMENLQIEAGFPVASPLPSRGDILSAELPAMHCATTLHTGPYTTIESAYNDLAAWMAQQGLTPLGSAYEFYLNDPQTTPEEKLQTQILMPLQNDSRDPRHANH